jgi:CRISPR-associated endoribonuclease Cas6
MMTNLLQLDGHSRLRADFSLVPWHNKFGWAVYLADDSHKQLATKLIDATLFDKPVQVKFGVFAKLKAPNWKQEHRGKLRIKVDTLTPVVIRADGQLRERPTNQSLHSGLTAMFLSRLGITDAALCSDIRKEARVHVVSDNTRLESIRIGGHFETVKGFFGSFTVEANASARWLLKCAQLIGLGGQTSIGFGRVKCQILE